ncbi:MAG: DUF420 domain-containing protein [Akkermansiaceae bacterium]
MPSHKEYLQREPNAALQKKLTRAAWVISAAIFGLVALMGRYKLDIGVDLSFLPPVHAVLNSLVAISLVIAFIAIKGKNVNLHRGAIGVAVVCSVLFLVCYVAYHGTQEEVRFGDLDRNGEVSEMEKIQAGLMRSVYLLVLLTHIVLAAVSLPFILITLSLGYTNHFARHKKMARWVFPLWLYVAATGPVCYFLLKPYY